MKVKNLLNNLHLPVWLVFILCVVMLLRIPSFFEPYSYGDEMIYLTLGEAIRQKIPLYLGIHDNKPPLLYITAAIAGNLFWFKAILAAFNLVSIVLFWKLLKALFPERESLHKAATAVFAVLTTIPLLEGNIVNAELFMVGFTIAAFYVLLTQKLSPRNLIFSGMLFSLAALFKIPAAFDLPVIIAFWLITRGLSKTKIIKTVKDSLFLLLGFLLPILLTFIWYYFRGALWQYWVAAFMQNFGYVSTWRPDDVQKPFLEKNLPLLLRGAVVALGTLIVFLKRKKLSQPFIFSSLWLLFTLFAVTLSERPYPHYLIQAVPPIAIFSAILLTEKTLEQSLAIIPLTLAFVVPVYFKFWYYPTSSYYLRFINLTLGKVTREEYLSSFGGHTQRNYQIAQYLQKTSKPTDKVFVSGDSSVIYALSKRLPPGKYVADYHIRDFSSKEEQAQLLKNTKPAFIIFLDEAERYPQLETFLKLNYYPLSSVEGAQIWKLK